MASKKEMALIDCKVTLIYPTSTYNGGWKNDPTFIPKNSYCRSMGTPKGEDGKSLMNPRGYRVGYGECRYYNGEEANDSIYKGEWDKDAPHGKGKYKNKQGDVYDGDWINGKMHGNGKLMFHDGKQYEGEFSQDKMHGCGRYIYSKDVYFDKEKEEFVEATDIVEGVWSNGELVQRMAEYTNYETIQSSELYGEAFPEF